MLSLGFVVALVTFNIHKSQIPLESFCAYAGGSGARKFS